MFDVFVIMARRAVLTGGLFGVLLALQSSVQPQPPVDLSWRSVMASVRPLQAVNPAGEIVTICTVTSINEREGYWLTAAHCVDAEIPTTIEGQPTTPVVVDAERDIAVLHADTHVRGVKIAKDQPRVGDLVNLIGYPVGLSIQYFHGNISSLDTVTDGTEHHMMFDMTACEGNSGSAIVDSHDHIVSVLQIGFGRGCSALTGGALWRDLVKIAGPYVG